MILMKERWGIGYSIGKVDLKGNQPKGKTKCQKSPEEIENLSARNYKRS